VPLVREPGCPPQLTAPLILAPVAFVAVDELLSAISGFCSPLVSGVALPASNLAISGATASDALSRTPESAAAQSARKGALYSRVLAPGQTQVTAMLAQRPTFVSVELAANEVLKATSGKLSSVTPFATWKAVYDQILAAVKSTGAQALLVGLPDNAADFPSMRRGAELYADRLLFNALNVGVSGNCRDNQNLIFVPRFVFTLLGAATEALARGRPRPTLSCADIPGQSDDILTPTDVVTLNAQLAQMNAYIRQKANENGYAYFALSALYDRPKPRYSLSALLTSNTPFGAYISLDGIHPSTAGHAILADAAAAAINAKYGFDIPVGGAR
jgi:lysophospholipase L1-like esterase